MAGNFPGHFYLMILITAVLLVKQRASCRRYVVEKYPYDYHRALFEHFSPPVCIIFL